jgi:hypothetical protein
MSIVRLDLISGGQAELALEAPDSFPSSYFISLGPSGTRVWQILTKLLVASKRSVCAFSAELDKQGLKRQDVTDSAMGNLLQNSGYAFGMFWDIDPVLARWDRADTNKFMLVRDPRDLVVSSYLAMNKAKGGAPASSPREAHAERDSNSGSILDYLRSPQVEALVRRYRRCADFCRSAKNVTAFRHEDVVFSWRPLVAYLKQELDLGISLELALAIADSTEVLAKGSTVGGEDSQGMQPTFQERLGKEAMAVLEQKFADSMAYFGYVPEEAVPAAFLDHAGEFLRAVSARLATANVECSDLAAQIRIATERADAGRFHNLVIPVTVLSADGGTSRTTGNIKYYYSGFNPYAVSNPGEGIRVLDGSPASIAEINDAYSVPGSMCLYDRCGVRIPESCIRRGKDLVEFAYAGADTVSLPSDFVTVDEPLVYLSFIEDHWGHFLTEGISRLWALVEYPELATTGGFFFSTSPVHDNIVDFVRSLGPNIRFGEYKANRSFRFRKVFVPRASFSNRGEAYSVHRKAAWALIDLHTRENRSEVSDQPVFLSRSKLGDSRDIQNQAELEKALARLGFLIVYPEELDLVAQIRLFNQYRHFSGCWGSAFHSAILAGTPDSITTHVMCNFMPNENFLMFDSILGNDANYVRSLFPVSGEAKVWPYLNLAVDVDQALRYFKGMF